MIKRSSQRFLKVLFVLLILVTIFSGFAFAQTVILNQTPNQVDAWGSDAGFPDAVADNFVVSSPARITQIRLWGIYWPSNTFPATDNFTVIFHSDSAGLPGAAVATESNVAVVRQATGGTVLSTFTEYEYTLTLATPVNLTPGTYWVEIYNDTGPTDNFYWELGTADPVNGVVSSASSLTAPGSTWYAAVPVMDLAIEITSEPIRPVPTINEWGMIIFMMLAGAGSLYFIRRQRRT
jgi:hypothetical protein